MKMTYEEFYEDHMQLDNAKDYIQEEEVKEENNQQEHFDVGSNGIEEPQ